MSISYVLVLLALGLFGCAVWAMFWAIDDGQYDDLEQHANIALEENGDIPDLLAKGDAPPKKGAAPLS
jgi:cbb3-type cytochrome oxidase maturation protein